MLKEPHCKRYILIFIYTSDAVHRNWLGPCSEMKKWARTKELGDWTRSHGEPTPALGSNHQKYKQPMLWRDATHDPHGNLTQWWQCIHEPWGVGRMGKKRAQDRYSFMGVILTGQSSVHYRHWNTDWLKWTIFHESVKTEFSTLGNSVSPDIKEQFSGFSFKYSSISSM